MTTTFSPYELLSDWFTKTNKNPSCLSAIVSPQRMMTIKNNLSQLSNELEKTEPFYSKQLFSLKDCLFTGYGNINPFVFGQIFEILQYIDYINTTPGQNIQLGFKEMLSGSMSALRNPKAHENIQLTSADAMRQIIFASMLMYKIDDGLAYSHVREN